MFVLGYIISICFGICLAELSCGPVPYFPHTTVVNGDESVHLPPNVTHITAHFTCVAGYHLVEGPSVKTCVNGTWSPESLISCVKLEDIVELADLPAITCEAAPTVINGRVQTDDTKPYPAQQGSSQTVTCNNGYSDQNFQTSFEVLCGRHGQWVTAAGMLTLPQCTRKFCPEPPKDPHATLNYSFSPLTEGQRIMYTCVPGYEMVGTGSGSVLTCHNGQWEGTVPTCEPIAKCPGPGYVEHGEWSVMHGGRSGHSSESFRDHNLMFEVGIEVEYKCTNGYKLVGPQVLLCLPSSIWSRAPPICIPEASPTWYCIDLGPMKTGYCKCEGEDSTDLTLCMPFHRGTRVQCSCQGGVDILTCTHSQYNVGVWEWDSTRCFKDQEPVSSKHNIYHNVKDYGKGYDTGDISDAKARVSSVVVVVTTACSVMGVLLLIMIIVVLRRKKQRAPLFPQGPTPPPYSRVTSSEMDEHDRMALMAYAEAAGVHLPSYEEAMRPPGILPITLGPHGGDYRRLPPVHPAVRGAVQHQQMQQQGLGGDGNNNINNNNNNNSNRHSIATTSTMNRDGISEIFGSVDTVNVSMSDASTSVTVETFESGMSNRSMASQRATAGSLTSSHDQLANEDAPLLDSVSQYDVVSVGSNPSRSSKQSSEQV